MAQTVSKVSLEEHLPTTHKQMTVTHAVGVVDATVTETKSPDFLSALQCAFSVLENTAPLNKVP